MAMVEAKSFPLSAQTRPTHSPVATGDTDDAILKNSSGTDGIKPPPEFYIDPSTLKTEKQLIEFLKSFDTWPSQLWIKYAQRWGVDGILAIPPQGKAERTIVTSATNPDNVYIVENMAMIDFAMLSREDAVRVAGTAAFDDVKGAFEFERATDARFDGLSFNDYVDSIISDMRSKKGKMSDEDLQPYLNQLQHVRDDVDDLAILKPSEIRKKISDIKEVFERAAHFSDIQPETYGPQGADAHYSNVISLDGGAAINRGYRIFVESDRKIAALEAQRNNLLKRFNTLDLPTLVTQVMMLDKQITDAKSVREGEELKQQNELSNTYAAMQDAINETLRLFSGKDGDDPEKHSLCDKKAYAELTDRQKKLVSMFTNLFGKDAQQHPLEAARSISRPLMDFVEDVRGYPLKTYTNAQWNTFGTQLSEVVTLLGQNTQLKMNDISTLQQMGTSQFEVASKAISRMTDLSTAISRNI